MAGRRCILAAREVGGVVLVIDAKNERATQWYQTYGALPLEELPLTLVLPLAPLHSALQEAGKG